MVHALEAAPGVPGGRGPTRRRSGRSGLLLRAAAGVTAAAIGLALGSGVSASAVVGAMVVVASLLMAVRRLDALVAVALLAFLLPSVRFGDTATFLTVRWIINLALLGVVAVRALAVRRRSGAAHPPPTGLLALTFVAVASIGWSVSPRLTAGRAVTFALLLVAILLVRIVAGGVAHVKTALKAVAALVAFANLVAFAAGGGGDRYAGVFNNPNSMGVATALLFPVALQEAFVGTTKRNRGVFALVAAVLAAEAAAAGSRGGLLAVTAAYLMIGLAHVRPQRDARRLVIFLLPALLAAVGAFTIADAHRFSTVNSRGSLWGLFPDLFRQRPVLGTGFGTTQIVLAPLSSETGYHDPRGVNFHNSFLNLLTDTGGLGGACFATVLFTAWRRRKQADGAMAAIVAAGLVSGLFESWMFSVGSGFAFVFWFGLIDVTTGSRRPRAPAQRSVSSRRVIAAM